MLCCFQHNTMSQIDIFQRHKTRSINKSLKYSYLDKFTKLKRVVIYTKITQMEKLKNNNEIRNMGREKKMREK